MVATGMGKRAAAAAPGGFQFELHSPDFHVPRDVVVYTRDKLAAKLAKVGQRLLGVVVRLKDENGPKGGETIVCHIEALLAGMEPVNVEERETDLRAAIDRAVECLDLAVKRHVERARSLPRNRGRKLVRHGKLAGPGGATPR